MQWEQQMIINKICSRFTTDSISKWNVSRATNCNQQNNMQRRQQKQQKQQKQHQLQHTTTTTAKSTTTKITTTKTATTTKLNWSHYEYATEASTCPKQMPLHKSIILSDAFESHACISHFTRYRKATNSHP